VIVVLPLLLGTISAAIEMRKLSTASERLVLNGVAATQYTQAIVRQITSLERTARLYQILRRPPLLETFRQNNRLLDTTLEGLERLPGDPQRAAVIENMRSATATIDGDLSSGRSNRINDGLARFTQLGKDAGQLSKLASEQTDRELNLLQAETESARRRLYWQSFALIPVTIGLVLVVSLFLVRPIREIDEAIENIGHGRLSKPVAIQGPSDLERLGRQLEWLRVRLGEISEERNRFLRHMSHELKTPLANIREGSELLTEGAVGPLQGEQREVAAILRENSLRLQRLIENLLSYSEWQTKRGGLDVTEFKLLPLVQAAVDNYQLPISTHRIRLETDVGDITVQADRAKLKLVLDNLVSNAVKFTPDGGTIAIRARIDDDTGQPTTDVNAGSTSQTPGSMLVIDVVDSGPGIAQEDRARIFDAFYQGVQPRGGLVRGTGIGLSVVQEFVQAHGGTVGLVDGEAPGAHFRITVPQDNREKESAAISA
jgi:two-component system sensor histidine kinase GlrK